MSEQDALGTANVSAATEATYAHAGMGQRLGFGVRPVVGVIDLQLAYTDPERSVLAGDLSDVIVESNAILAAARRRQVPVIFTVEGWDPDGLPTEAGLALHKIPTISTIRTDGELVQLDPRVERAEGEPLILKKYPSAFFGTPLLPMLTSLRADTLIIVGCSTSGCIRATAMDALNNGFRPIVPFDAVGDRAPEPHRAALFIQMKYGDVIPASEVVAYLQSQPVVAVNEGVS